jgi:hypothetical protein
VDPGVWRATFSGSPAIGAQGFGMGPTPWTPRSSSFTEYFLWAETMRTDYAALAERVGINDESVYLTPYLSYWYAGLYVVIEGWRELRLSDKRVDPLVSSSSVGVLRRWRNGAFHFQRRYVDQRFLEWVRAPGAGEWLDGLHAAFSGYFAEFLEKKLML